MSKFTSAPIKDPPILKTGLFSQSWVQWFLEVYAILSGKRPIQLASYEVLTMPDPEDNAATLIYVSDATGGAIPAFSDGTNWRRVDTRAIVT